MTTATRKKTKEFTGQVRTAKFEVHKINGEPVWSKKLKKPNSAVVRWDKLSDQCKQIINCIWETWLVWHVQNGCADNLRDWLNKRASDGKKAAGKCPVQPVPKELQNHIYHVVSKRFTDVNKRVVVLILNITIGDLKTHKASKGSLPGHSAILLNHQSIPSSTRPQPIPFDCQNTKMIPPEEKGDNFKVELRVWRMHDETKSTSPSIIDSVELYCRPHRRILGELAKLKRIMLGEYKFCGSELVYEQKKRKWFVHLCYRMPTMVQLDLDPNKVATLIPHSERPWHFILPGVKRREWPGGNGYYVAGIRRRIYLQRRSRSKGYRDANKNREGHGFNRAGAWRWKIQSTWNSFVKRVNHNATSEVVQRCVDSGIGTLVYFQPEGDFSESRFLSSAGKDERWNDATTWQWFQVKTMLEYKCKAVGIQLLDGSDGRKAIVEE